MTAQTDTYSRRRGNSAHSQCLAHCLVHGNPWLKVTLIRPSLFKHALAVWLLQAGFLFCASVLHNDGDEGAAPYQGGGDQMYGSRKELGHGL